MLNVPEAVKALFKTDGIQKNFRVHFPNSEYRDLTNSDIVAGSVKFTESVCSKDVLQFGLAEASRIEFECVGVPNIYGATIECFCEVDTSSLSAEYQTVKADVSYPVYAVPYGLFRVQSCPRNAGAMTHRRVEGYSTALEKSAEMSSFLRGKLSARVANTPTSLQVVPLLVAQETNDITGLTLTESTLTDASTSMQELVRWHNDGHLYTAYWTPLSGFFHRMFTINNNLNSLLRFTCDIDISQIEQIYTDAIELGIPAEEMQNLRGILEPSVWYPNGLRAFIPFDDPTDSGYIYPHLGDMCYLSYPSPSSTATLRIDRDGALLHRYEYTSSYISNVVCKRYDLTDTSQMMRIQIKQTSGTEDGSSRYHSFINSLDYGSLFDGYEELSASYGQASRSGWLKSVTLSKSSPVTISKSEHSDFWFDEYSISPIGSIKYTYYDIDLKQEQTQIYSFGEGLSEYDMTDNYLLKHLAVSASDLTNDQTVEEYVQSLFDTYFIPNITDISFIPVDLDMIGLPYIEAGDYIEVVAEDNTVVGTYVLSRTLSGEQYLTDAVESKGGEIIGSSVRSA